MSQLRLPNEVHLEILKYLMDNQEQLANYAAVSGLWQEVIETRTMHTVGVRSTEIDKFERIFQVKRRRRNLRHLVFILELQREEALSLDKEMSEIQMVTEICAKADELEWPSVNGLWQRQENRYFGSTMHAFLHELSLWKQEEIFGQGIILELVIGSLSHWQRLATACDYRSCNDPILIGDRHIGIKRQRAAIIGAKQNFCDMIDLELDPSMQLSKVPAISSLLVSENSGRVDQDSNPADFDPDVVGKLMGALPALRKFDWGIAPPLIMGMPFEMKLLRLAENGPSTLQDIRIAQRSPLFLTRNSFPFSRPEKKLAERAQNLACLCFNSRINAFSFFAACNERQYPELRCLAIQSYTFDHFWDVARQPPPALLQLVAASISRMPKLEHLVVFTQPYGDMGLITYKTMNAGKTRILTCSCTWHFLLRDELREDLRKTIVGGGDHEFHCIAETSDLDKVRPSIEEALKNINEVM